VHQQQHTVTKIDHLLRFVTELAPLGIPALLSEDSLLASAGFGFKPDRGELRREACLAERVIKSEGRLIVASVRCRLGGPRREGRRGLLLLEAGRCPQSRWPHGIVL
jgi:hypothetical protein